MKRSRIVASVIGLFIGVAIVLFLFFVEPDIPLQALKQTYAPPPSRFVEIGKMDVHYRDEGSGPTILLLHGTGASLHTWDGWVSELSDSLRLIRLDLPGFGLTGPDPDRDYSMSRYTRFIAAFLDSIRVSRIHLAGNSLGGHIAWQFALDFPDRVESLILIDPGGYPKEMDSGSPLVFTLARIPGISSLLTRISPRYFVRKSLLDVYADDSRVTEPLIQRHIDMALREGNRAAFVDRLQTPESNRFDEIGSISQPVLIMWGDQDTWIPATTAAHFESALTNVRVLRYPNAGHVPMEEIPRQTARDVFRFIRSVS